MSLFVMTELMLFSGFISAHTIVRASARGAIWPPPGQPRLPVEATAVTTALLIASGVLLFLAGKALKKGSPSFQKLLLGCVVLGMVFVGAQGTEWAALLNEGLTVTSSVYGGFFYVIIGCHALHAVVALLFLMRLQLLSFKGTMTPEQLWTVQTLWYFVVGMWPVLYTTVYL